jgi:hypothetical protein
LYGGVFYLTEDMRVILFSRTHSKKRAMGKDAILSQQYIRENEVKILHNMITESDDISIQIYLDTSFNGIRGLYRIVTQEEPDEKLLEFKQKAKTSNVTIIFCKELQASFQRIET